MNTFKGGRHYQNFKNASLLSVVLQNTQRGRAVWILRWRMIGRVQGCCWSTLLFIIIEMCYDIPKPWAWIIQWSYCRFGVWLLLSVCTHNNVTQFMRLFWIENPGWHMNAPETTFKNTYADVTIYSCHRHTGVILFYTQGLYLHV